MYTLTVMSNIDCSCLGTTAFPFKWDS